MRRLAWVPFVDTLGPVAIELHILTHGRVYTEAYPSVERALQAARALEEEPREHAVKITIEGRTHLDEEALDRLLGRAEED